MSPSSSSLHIRTATRAEVVQVHKAWASEQQWNPGTPDAALFPNADDRGFFIGSVDGRDVACVSCLKYGPTAFLGYYIVRDPADRGNGYGLALFRHAQEYAKGCNIGLDGVEPQQANYAKSGFTKTYDNWRFEKTITADAKRDDWTAPAGTRLVTDISDSVVDAVVEYDATYSGLRRPKEFFKAWLAHPDIKSVILQSANTGDGRAAIVGFGTIRPAAVGHRIGPVFAASADIARSVITALTSKVDGGSKVFVDVCLGNGSSRSVFEAEGFSEMPGWSTGRMWTDGLPIEPRLMDGFFASMTLEIG